MRANLHTDAHRIAVQLAAASLLCAGLSACGDDFARAESVAADVVAGLDTGLQGDTGAQGDTGLQGDIAADAGSLDTWSDTTIDSGADTGSLQDDVAPLPGACTADVDCAGEASMCQVAVCKPTGCVVSAATDGTPCDDGVACTQQDACVGGVCKADTAACACAKTSDCAAFDDEDACDGTMYCKIDSSGLGSCQIHPATVPECPEDGDPCTTVACEPQSGSCVTTDAANGTACDDGVACSEQDTCQAGLCQGGPSICECQTSADCAAKDDANLCNGTLFCDKTSWPFQCRTNPLTVVTCADTTAPNDCTAVACAPATGLCAAVTLTDGTPCDDGESCTKGDVCTAGTCAGPTNVCPCSSTKDCTALEDSDACNGSLYCETKAGIAGCRVNPATIVTCPAEQLGPCLAPTCQPSDGSCKPMPTETGTPCEDGEICTTGDSCSQGACKSGANGCACTKQADCAPFEDGNACNGTLYCDTSTLPFACRVNAKTVITCPDNGDQCTEPACDPATGACGVVPLPDGVTCDADGFGCTAKDVCTAGTCVAGTNVCTCTKPADCDQHEDGNLCNGTLFCDKSDVPFVCKVNPTTEIVCAAPAPGGCSVVACDAKTGACVTSNAPDGVGCNADGDACTSGDACKAGQCVAGPNTCSCSSDSDCAALDDGDSCTGTLYCDKSALPFGCKTKPNSVKTCDPSNDSACVQNVCSKSACSMTTLVDGSPCEDGVKCTIGDACASGGCKPGKNLCGCNKDSDCIIFDNGDLCDGIWFCDLQNGNLCAPKPQSAVVCTGPISACSLSLCVPGTGACEAVPLPFGVSKACDDGSLCTTNDTCVGGACKGAIAKDCDDGNACTVDQCNAQTGCKSTFATTGSTCSDGDACSIGDACADGKCVAGKPKVCPDGAGCDAWACVGGICKLSKGSIGCSDGNPCTLDACEGADGCSYAPDALATNCGTAGLCKSGSCGTCPTWSRLYQSGTTALLDGFAGAVDGANGAWTLVGTRLHGAKTLGTWSTRLSASGEVLTQLVEDGSLTSFEPAAATSADGGTVHAGRVTVGAFDRAYMRLVDDSFQTKWTWSESAGTTSTVFHAVAKRSAGSFWVGVGQFFDGKVSGGYLVEVDDKGNSKASAMPVIEKSTLDLRGVAAAPGQDWVLAGERNIGTGYLVRVNKLVKLNSTLDFVWTVDKDKLQDRPLAAVAEFGVDQYAAAGMVVPQNASGVTSLFVVAVAASSGKIAWTWTGSNANGGSLLGIAPIGSHLVAVGARDQGLGGGATGVLVGLTSVGKLDWLTQVGNGLGASTLRAVIPVNGGGLAVGNFDSIGGDSKGWAVHFDEKGQIFCGP